MTDVPSPVEVGWTISRSLPLSAEDIMAGARFLGDRHPLHYDAVAASASRFGELIASGPMSPACTPPMLRTELSGFGAPLGLEFTARYVAAVKAGDIAMSWSVVSVDAKPSLGGHFLRVDGAVRSERDEMLIFSQGLVLLGRSL